MKISYWLKILFGRIAIVGLIVAAMFISGGCPRVGKPSIPTTGTLAVGLSFGSAGSYRCDGGGSVTVTPTGGAPQTKRYQFSGIASSASPGCSESVIFGSLPPGLAQISCSCGVSCTTSVTAGQITNVTIRTDARTCQ